MGGTQDPLGLLNTLNGATPSNDQAAANQQYLQNLPQQPQQQPQQATQGQSPQGQGQQPQQDPLDQVKQALTQRVLQNQQQQQAPSNNGGAIKRLLGNFFSGAGAAMMQHAGLPTPYQQQQRDLANLQGIETTQANTNLHQMMAGMYGTVPYQVPNSADPSGFTTINVMQKDIPKLEQARQAAAAKQNTAAITGQYGLQRAQINQGINIPITDEMRQMLPDLPQGIQSLPLHQLNQMMGVETKPLAVAQGENGPAIINKLNPSQATQLPIGNPRAMFNPMNRPVQTVDPNNPDNVIYQRAGTAIAQGASSPASVPFQTNKAITKSAVSGPIGDQLAAFNTAVRHASLLKQAADTLNNPSSRTYSSVRNVLTSEFGDTDLTNYQAIAGAYSREITKMLSGGHMTDAEIASSGGTLPSNATPQTISKVLDSYKALAQSKIDVLKNRVQQGQSGHPAFTTPQTGGGFAAWKAQQGR